MRPTIETLIRWSGLANMSAGLLTAVFWWIHPGLEDPSNALKPLWMGSYMLFVALIILFMWGLTGLYLRQSEPAGLLGLVGYLLGFIASAFFVGAGAFDAFVTPALRTGATAMLEPDGPLMAGALGKYFMVTGLSYATGYVLFGIATLRAGVFPKWMAALMILSVPVLGLSPLMPPLARIVGCAVFGAANIGLGYENWSGGARQRSEAGKGVSR